MRLMKTGIYFAGAFIVPDAGDRIPRSRDSSRDHRIIESLITRSLPVLLGMMSLRMLRLPAFRRCSTPHLVRWERKVH